MRTDFELLDAWRGGDTSAGSELFERHYHALIRFFRNKVGDDAEDLVQQTLLSCVRTLDCFRQEAPFATYLFRAARSRLYDYWRRRSVRPRADVGVTSVADMGLSPSQVLARADEQHALLSALRHLPLDQQVALELYYFQELRGPELARVLEVPEGTVRSRLRLAKRALERHLSRAKARPRHEVQRSDSA